MLACFKVLSYWKHSWSYGVLLCMSLTNCFEYVQLIVPRDDGLYINIFEPELRTLITGVKDSLKVGMASRSPVLLDKISLPVSNSQGSPGFSNRGSSFPKLIVLSSEWSSSTFESGRGGLSFVIC